ncbi:hypothetical protein BKA93DRAFT_579181 [Sparassis latifolia]
MDRPPHAYISSTTAFASPPRTARSTHSANSLYQHPTSLSIYDTFASRAYPRGKASISSKSRTSHATTPFSPSADDLGRRYHRSQSRRLFRSLCFTRVKPTNMSFRFAAVFGSSSGTSPLALFSRR